jgi:hypothetical protein
LKKTPRVTQRYTRSLAPDFQSNFTEARPDEAHGVRLREGGF